MGWVRGHRCSRRRVPARDNPLLEARTRRRVSSPGDCGAPTAAAQHETDREHRQHDGSRWIAARRAATATVIAWRSARIGARLDGARRAAAIAIDGVAVVTRLAEIDRAIATQRGIRHRDYTDVIDGPAAERQ